MMVCSSHACIVLVFSPPGDIKVPFHVKADTRTVCPIGGMLSTRDGCSRVVIMEEP